MRQRFALLVLLCLQTAAIRASGTEPVADARDAEARSDLNLICGADADPIDAIQGVGASSELIGETVEVEAVVTRNLGQGLGGLFLEEDPEDRDDNPATSEGLFVVLDRPMPGIRPGMRVRVHGRVAETGTGTATNTALDQVSGVMLCQGGAQLPHRIVLDGLAPEGGWERFENMRVSADVDTTVTGNDALLRDGALAVSFDGRRYAAREHVAAGVEAQAAAQANSRAIVLLDDARRSHAPATVWWLGTDAIDQQHAFRAGTTVRGVRGILDQRDGAYRIELAAKPVTITHAPRPLQPPRVDGQLRVASFNMLNFFNGDGKGGGFPTPRGAVTEADYQRQRAKLVAALIELRPDVAALMEVENDGHGPEAALSDLVRTLNARSGLDYRAIDTHTPQWGRDNIRVAMIYRPSRATPIGKPLGLTTGAFAELNRVPLAQTFAPAMGGKKITVVANHFKSKGGCPTEAGPDADQGDGQACWNARRTAAAKDLATWLATDPTKSRSADVLIVGDLNAYGEEDPLRALRAQGYVDVVAAHVGPEAYSFVFDGLAGRLDHAMASPGLAARVSGAGEWHINADELEDFDYRSQGRDSDAAKARYQPTPWRSSDHDPLLIGINPL